MKIKSGNRSWRMLAIFLAGLSVLWLVSLLAPKLVGEQTHFATSFFLGLLLLSTLRWATRFTGGPERAFWGWVTIACALNLLGNVAWGLYELISGKKLGVVSLIEGLYIARYLAILLGLWYFSRPWSWKHWITHVIVLAGTMAVIWAILLRPALPVSELPAIALWGGALYPTVDTVLLYSALSIWLDATSLREKRVMGLFSVALFFYGAANWINFGLRVLMAPTNLSLWASLGWGISDIVATMAALYALLPVTEVLEKEE